MIKYKVGSVVYEKVPGGVDYTKVYTKPLTKASMFSAVENLPSDMPVCIKVRTGYIDIATY